MRAGNVFDDGWEAPKSSPSPTTKPLTVVTPKPAEIAPVKPLTEVQPALVAPPVVQPGRRAIPNHVEQSKSRKLMKELFLVQLKDTSPGGRRKLVQALLDEVHKVGAENATDRFVLLAATIEASKEAGDLSLCFNAAAEMANSFDIDLLAVRADSTLKLPPGAYRVAGASSASASSVVAANIRLGLEVVNDLTQLDDFSAAAHLVQVLQQGAATDSELRAATLKEAQEITAAREARKRFDLDCERLMKSPEDANANLSVGMYLCFNRNDWNDGLPMLAKASNPAIRAQAILELAKPTSANALGQLGDGWWDVAEKQTPTVRLPMRRHAATLYRSAMDMDQTRDLHRGLMEKRVAEAKATEAPSQPMQRIVLVGTSRGAMMAYFAMERLWISEWLKVLPDNASFNVIFDIGPTAMEPKSLVKATPDQKKAAQDFVDKRAPVGPGDPRQALQMAFDLKPQIIYFHCTGESPDSAKALKWFEDHNKDHVVRVNVIYWVTDPNSPNDGATIAEGIATKNGGIFTKIDGGESFSAALAKLHAINQVAPSLPLPNMKARLPRNVQENLRALVEWRPRYTTGVLGLSESISSIAEAARINDYDAYKRALTTAINIAKDDAPSNRGGINAREDVLAVLTALESGEWDLRRVPIHRKDDRQEHGTASELQGLPGVVLRSRE